MKMKTKNITYLLFFLLLLGIVLFIIYHFSYWKLAVPDSPSPYYWLPREQYLVAAYDLYIRSQYFMIARPVSLIFFILVFILIIFVRLFKSLSMNFESFDEAWRALKAFTRESSKKSKLMLSVLLADFLFGLSIGAGYLLFGLPYGPLFMFSSLLYAVNYFLYSSPLLPHFEILMILMYYAQTGFMYTVFYGMFFIPLIVVLIIGWRYESAFWKEIKALSPKSFKSST